VSDEHICQDCGEPADILDTEFDEYFCVKCAKRYDGTLDEIVEFTPITEKGKELRLNG
jgi:hypothetical protein